MTDKEFRRLSRSDLIEIIYELQQDEKTLRGEIENLKQKLEDRRIVISEAGSLADALAKLNGLFEAAQATADSYVEEMGKDRADAQTLMEEAERTREQADSYMADMREQADSYMADMRQQAAKLAALTMQQRKDMLAQTAEECRRLRATAQKGQRSLQPDGGNPDSENTPDPENAPASHKGGTV